MSLINLTGSSNQHNLRKSLSRPVVHLDSDGLGPIRDRKESSQQHYQTQRETSDAAFDAAITDTPWIERFKTVWDCAPTPTVLKIEIETIKAEILSYFAKKGEKAVAAQKIQQWMAQSCWGFPGYCRSEEEGKIRKEKARKKARRLAAAA